MKEPVIILDNGSGYLKAGLSNEQLPSIIIPSLVGRSLSFGETIGDIKIKPLMIGDEVSPVRPFLELSYPMKEGIITNDEDMAILWYYVLTKKLGFEKNDLKDRKILLTESPFNPDKKRIKMGEILFEKIGVGFFHIEPKAKMVLYSIGEETGLLLELFCEL